MSLRKGVLFLLVLGVLSAFVGAQSTCVDNGDGTISVTNETGVSTLYDMCNGATSWNFACDSSASAGYSLTSTSCPSGQACSPSGVGGACVSYSCVDSDPSNDLSVAGTVTRLFGNGVVFEDRDACSGLSSGSVTQVNCGNSEWVPQATTSCPSGSCSNGACSSLSTSPAACGDSLDNDADGAIDYPLDQGCNSSSDSDESNSVPPAASCSDGLDNDGDGLADLADPGCSSSSDGDEYNVPLACEDTDGGLRPLQFGEVDARDANGNYFFGTDFCLAGDANHVVEMHCNGLVFENQTLECPSGTVCSAGVCTPTASSSLPSTSRGTSSSRLSLKDIFKGRLGVKLVSPSAIPGLKNAAMARSGLKQAARPASSKAASAKAASPSLRLGAMSLGAKSQLSLAQPLLSGGTKLSLVQMDYPNGKVTLRLESVIEVRSGDVIDVGGTSYKVDLSGGRTDAVGQGSPGDSTPGECTQDPVSGGFESCESEDGDEQDEDEDQIVSLTKVASAVSRTGVVGNAKSVVSSTAARTSSTAARTASTA
ncbi:hypothetical protein HY501_00675, partial [Candidatus Woesearchaeota archaeon]|nr:hypothetical protein [Candidatus Woesearchaeota archaeon]